MGNVGTIEGALKLSPRELGDEQFGLYAMSDDGPTYMIADKIINVRLIC